MAENLQRVRLTVEDDNGSAQYTLGTQWPGRHLDPSAIASRLHAALNTCRTEADAKATNHG